MGGGRVIRCSEVGQYAFCATSWWLNRVRGVHPDNVRDLVRGQTMHAAHGRSSQASTVMQRVGLMLLVAGAVIGLLLVAVLLGERIG